MSKKIIYSIFAAASLGLYSFFGKGAVLSYSPVLKTVQKTKLTYAPLTFKDGEFLGESVFAFYGRVQVQVSIEQGKIQEIIVKKSPKGRLTSEVINGQALPLLIEEALNSQSANVDVVTGATDTSKAFKESLNFALKLAL